MMTKLDYYMKIPYRLEIIPDKEEGGFVISYPELPGCISCAETKEEIWHMAEDAKKAWLMAALEAGYEIPLPVAEKISA